MLAVIGSIKYTHLSELFLQILTCFRSENSRKTTAFVLGLQRPYAVYDNFNTKINIKQSVSKMKNEENAANVFLRQNGNIACCRKKKKHLRKMPPTYFCPGCSAR